MENQTPNNIGLNDVDYLMPGILKIFYTGAYAHVYMYVCMVSSMFTFIKTVWPLKIIRLSNIPGHVKMLLL